MQRGHRIGNQIRDQTFAPDELDGLRRIAERSNIMRRMNSHVGSNCVIISLGLHGLTSRENEDVGVLRL